MDEDDNGKFRLERVKRSIPLNEPEPVSVSISDSLSVNATCFDIQIEDISIVGLKVELYCTHESCAHIQ